MSRREHACKPGDGCPRNVVGSNGHQYRVALDDVSGKWTVHDCTGVSGRGGDDVPMDTRKRARPPLRGRFSSYGEAVAAALG